VAVPLVYPTQHSQVFAHENCEGLSNWFENYRPDGGEHLVFNYTYNPKPTVDTDSLGEAKKYINNL
jgi:extracellular elastinolytic metalloproteinase